MFRIKFLWIIYYKQLFFVNVLLSLELEIGQHIIDIFEFSTNVNESDIWDQIYKKKSNLPIYSMISPFQLATSSFTWL